MSRRFAANDRNIFSSRGIFISCSERPPAIADEPRRLMREGADATELSCMAALRGQHVTPRSRMSITIVDGCRRENIAASRFSNIDAARTPTPRATPPMPAVRLNTSPLAAEDKATRWLVCF